MCKCWVYHIKIFGVRHGEILKSIQKILTDEKVSVSRGLFCLIINRIKLRVNHSGQFHAGNNGTMIKILYFISTLWYLAT